jgi:hypothetical protein
MIVTAPNIRERVSYASSPRMTASRHHLRRHSEEARPLPSQEPLWRGLTAVVTKSIPGHRRGHRESRSPEDSRSQPSLQKRSAAAVRVSPPPTKPLSGPPEAMHRDGRCPPPAIVLAATWTTAGHRRYWDDARGPQRPLPCAATCITRLCSWCCLG